MNISEIMISMETMDHEELSQIVLALIRNWSRVHPEDEFVVLSLPREDKESRKQILAGCWRFLQNEKCAGG